MSAIITKAEADLIVLTLSEQSGMANSDESVWAVAHAIEALVGAQTDIGVGIAEGHIVMNFPVEGNRHGGIPHLLDSLVPAAGWEGKVEVVDGTTWVQIHMRQAEAAAAEAATATTAPAAASVAPVVQKLTAAPAAPKTTPTPVAATPVAAAPIAAAPAPAAVVPAAATGAIEQLLAQLTSSVNSVSSVIAAASTERNALLAATQAALTQRQECDKALAALTQQVDVAKQATAAAQTAAQAAVAALAAKAAAPAAAPKATSVDWMDSTAVKVGLGVAAAGAVIGAGYFAYNRFFGNNAE